MNVVTVGQIKHASKKFLDRIAEVDAGRTGTRKFLEYSGGSYVPLYTSFTATDPSNKYVANIGQLSRAFAFDLLTDADGDGMPRWWEWKYMNLGFDLGFEGDSSSNPGCAYGPSGDFDFDGISNITEWNNGTNPAAPNGSPPIATYSVNQVLLVWDDDFLDSRNLKDFYKANRPGFASIPASQELGLNLGTYYNNLYYTNGVQVPPTRERINEADFNSKIYTHILNKFTANTNLKYVVFMYGMPTRVYRPYPQGTAKESYGSSQNSVPFLLSKKFCGVRPFYLQATYITAADYTDAEAYVKRLAAVPAGTRRSPNTTTGPLLSGPRNADGSLPPTRYYLDDDHIRLNKVPREPVGSGKTAETLILAITPSQSIEYNYQVGGLAGPKSVAASGYESAGSRYNPITNGTDDLPVAADNAITNYIRFPITSWYLITTNESFNGIGDGDSHSSYHNWLAYGAFHLSPSPAQRPQAPAVPPVDSYMSCPIAAITNSDEPGNSLAGTSTIPTGNIWPLWHQGFPFIQCAWSSESNGNYLPIGDPFVIR